MRGTFCSAFSYINSQLEKGLGAKWIPIRGANTLCWYDCLAVIVKSAANQLGTSEAKVIEGFTGRKHAIAEGPWFDCFCGTVNCAATQLGVSAEDVVRGWLQYKEHFAEALARGLITKKDIALISRSA